MMTGREARSRSRAMRKASVGEHSGRRRIRPARGGGAPGNEDVGMSNDNAGEKPARRKPKVS